MQKRYGRGISVLLLFFFLLQFFLPGVASSDRIQSLEEVLSKTDLVFLECLRMESELSRQAREGQQHQLRAERSRDYKFMPMQITSPGRMRIQPLVSLAVQGMGGLCLLVLLVIIIYRYQKDGKKRVFPLSQRKNEIYI